MVALFDNAHKQNTSKIKEAHTKSLTILDGLEILSASSFTTILALPESRAPWETDNANKVST